jgi:hypothetical protein
MTGCRGSRSLLAVAALWLGLAAPCPAEPTAPTSVSDAFARQLEATGLRAEVLATAFHAAACADAGRVATTGLLAIIDYSLPSTARRLWVLDRRDEALLFHALVAHGKGSGENYATRFSNEERSLATSLGLYRTGDVYQGQHGTSLELVGLEPGWNDRAMERRIVIHGADYVSDDFARRVGRLGRSWGCPALERDVALRLIERLKGGSLMLAYYPDPEWLRSSRFLSCRRAD